MPRLDLTFDGLRGLVSRGADEHNQKYVAIAHALANIQIAQELNEIKHILGENLEKIANPPVIMDTEITNEEK